MEMSEDAKNRKLHPRKDQGEHGCHVASHSVILENVSKPHATMGFGRQLLPIL